MNVLQLFEKSKRVSLVLPLGAGETDTHEARILQCGFRKLGKQVVLEHAQTAPLAPLSEEKTFVVSLRGLAPWIAKVRYEKEASDLKLYFTLNQTAASSQDVSLHAQNQTDLIIIVGDNSNQNNESQSLLIPILSANEAKKQLFDLLCSNEEVPTRVLGVVLSKLEYSSRLNTYLVSLREQDFQNMHAKPQNLPLVIPMLTENFGEQSSYLFLLDAPHGAQGLLWSSSPLLRAKFRDIAGGQQKGPWVLLRPAPFASEQLKYAFLS